MFRSKQEIQLKTPEQIVLMRTAGLVVADALAAMREAVAPGVSTADLDAVALSVIRKAGAVPSFLGYHGYPASICASVNNAVVHGIPSRDEVLRPGDLVSVDVGAIVDGWHGDAAISVVVEPVSEAAAALVHACEQSLWAGISAFAAGGKLTDISNAVQRSVESVTPIGGRRRYGIVEGYGGHGIGTEMHQDPHVLNHGRAGKGPDLIPGMALAIEPMITLGKPATRELDDGWTVITRDGSLAAHVEHTVALCDDGLWVLTAHDGGRAQLGDRITARQP